MLATRPGWVSADTKTYLYLDPGQLLRRAPSMWDPSVGMGTVTHQRIGFLWPMGPFYWLTEAVGLPDWVAQRLWWGSIIFAAGAGVAYLLRTLGWKGPGVTAAVFTYALSPVILTLMARLSGVLLPFAGLPWLVGFTIQALRHRGWRHPALFALTVATFGSVNATGLLLVGLAPVLWLPYSVWGSREAKPRQAALTGLKLAVPTVAVSAWWIAGLNVQRTHGVDIIRYTETAKTVASASVSNEVWRGLGYWFFYGRDRLGPWIEPSYGYTQWPHLIALTYLIPLLGIAGAAIARWQHRAFFVLLILVGLTLGVGAYPWDDNPPFGRLVQRFQETDAGLAMRSLPRAVPLVALGTAVLLGAGVTSLVARWPQASRPATWTAVVLAVLTLPPLWLGQFVPRNLRRQEAIPTYWERAADHLDAQGDDTRVLVVPGSDFAAYRWGNTVDPVLPGLMERGSLQRETVPNGTAASANLLNALDLTMQEGTAEPAALAPIARLMRAGDLLVVSDWQYERTSLPEPEALWDLVQRADVGPASTFAAPGPRRSIERDRPPELAVVPVDGVPAIVGTHVAESPLLVAGDGAGLVDAAAAGLIDGTELIRYSAALDDEALATALEDGAVLLLTDSNRKRGEHWNTLRHTRGHTETVSGSSLKPDLNDNRLPLFPAAGTDSQTVVVREGPISAEATSYGNAITYVPADRPMLAVDGDPDTAWRTAAYADARGERIELDLAEPVTTGEVRLAQPDGERRVTKVRLRFDGEDPLVVDLDDRAQTIGFPERRFTQLSVEILGDAGDGQAGVGFSEIEIAGITNTAGEIVRLPVDLLGAGSLDHPLAISLSRQRLDPFDDGLAEESALRRRVELPDARSFGLSGTARLTGSEALAALLGRPEDGTVPFARSGNLARDQVGPTASSVFDGDPATAWTAQENSMSDQWVEVELPAPVTLSTLPLTIVDDEDHSRPKTVTVSVDGEDRPPVDLPAGDETVDIDLGGEVTGRTFRITVDAVEPRVAPDAIYGDPIPPIALAEVGLPGPTIPQLADSFDSGCRDDLLTVDDQPVPIRVQGRMADALAARPLAVSLCEGEVELQQGDNDLIAVAGRETGLDLDRLVLRSLPGGAADTATTPLVDDDVNEDADDDVTNLVANNVNDDATSDVANTVDSTATSDVADAVHNNVASDVDNTATSDVADAVHNNVASDVDNTVTSDVADAVDNGLARDVDDTVANDVAAPRVEVVHNSADEVKIHVTGAEPGTPFWLVLGQSYSPGWQADIGGRPELVDGFANGWRVSPTASEFAVTLTFTPQAQVDRALWLSLVAALACVALAVRPARRRTIVATGAVPTAWAFTRALRFQGTRPGRRRAGLVVVVLAGLAWFVAGPAVGAVIGVGAAATARHPARRRWLLLASPVSLGLVALYVIGAQVVSGPKPGLDWPFHMRLVHPLGWCAALFLVADVVISAAWRDGRGSYLPTSGNQMPLADDVSVEGGHEADLVKTK